MKPFFTQDYVAKPAISTCKLVNERINVVYQRFIAIYDIGRHICCKWSRLKPGFIVPTHRSTMSQINMIPHPDTLNWHWANQPRF